MKNKQTLYLAQPFTHWDSTIVDLRIEAAADATAMLIIEGYLVFSPILQTKTIRYRTMAHSISETDWMLYCLDWLRNCIHMKILKLPGWDTSHGVAIETNFVSSQGYEYGFLDPEIYVHSDTINALTKRHEELITENIAGSDPDIPF